MTKPYHDNTLQNLFFNPLNDLYPISDCCYSCHKLSDMEYLQMGIQRCIRSDNSGHGFIQTYRKTDGDRVSVSLFFESIKSNRRLNHTMSMNQLMKGYLYGHIEDELSQIQELKNWHILAADGHYHKAALFDPKTKADTSEKEPSKSPTGHFFALDLRTHHLGYMDLAQPEDGKKSEHDMKMLKRQELESLRDGAPKGNKVFYFWDRACMDYEFWLKAKTQKGIYFATLEKSNSVTTYIREHSEIDYSDKRNEGIISDRRVATSEGYEVRQIVYVNPEDGVEYRYLTNEVTLPAWIIVLLYKHRWDIEKVFDELKTKLKEQRSWASAKEAKKSHGLFLCLAHNLMILLEERIKREENMSDQVEPKKKITREKTRVKGWRKKFAPSYINSFFKRATQRTERFIRWLRDSLLKSHSYRQSLNELAFEWKC